MEALSAVPDPWQREVDRLAKMIRTLFRIKGGKQKDLVLVLHVDETSVSRKIKTGTFSFRELLIVADFFNEPLETLLKDPDALITWSSPLSLVSDASSHRATQLDLPFTPVFSVVTSG